ncbi:MAG: glycosyltransferase family 4 protein [Motiliproteus sp.]
MRILFLISDMGRGGAERVASLLANAWSERGDQVLLLATYSGKGHCVYPLDESVRFAYLADRVKHTKGPLGYLKRLLVLRSVVGEYQPDVVVSFLTNVNVFALLATAGQNVPVIISERTYPPMYNMGPVMEWLRRWTYPQATSVVVQTTGSQGWLDGICPNLRSAVIANPVRLPMANVAPRVRPEQRVNSERRLLLTVGRLSCEKQFELLLDSFALLPVELGCWDLAIVGEGSLRASLTQKIIDLGLQQRVFLIGGVGNPGDWYRRADLYVMSSAFEGFPNTLLEAMAHGVAAVSFDCQTGPRDIIRHGIDGLLVDPQTGAAGLAASLTELMENEPKRIEFAVRACDVRQRYSMTRILLQWDEVFRDCLAAKGRSL